MSSNASHPLDQFRTVRVEGWPGKIRLAYHPEPADRIVADTEVNLSLQFQIGGLGVLRLNAFIDHAPGTENLLLTVSVPNGQEIDLLPKSQRIM